jgi:uncharacterized membrane protein
MDPHNEPPRRRISRRRFEWLRAESDGWRARGIVDDGGRDRILDAYVVESAEHRGMTALLGLAALMLGIGAILLIGYNWDRIPVAAKVAGQIALVAATFGASAFTAARGRSMASEALAFVGTLFFGSAIWLIAQVLHISGHFPDAFFWWGAGTLACAYLVRSTGIGIVASLLLATWIVTDGARETAPSNLTFILVGPLLVDLAYRLRSPVMLRIAAVAVALWAVLTPPGFSILAALGGLAVSGCAFSAIGTFGTDSRMQRAWRTAGLAILLVALVPLLFSEVHEEAPRVDRLEWLALAPMVPLAAVCWLVAGRRQRFEDAVFGIVPAAVLAWTAAIAAGWTGATFAFVSTLVFSALALGLAVTLIRAAVHRNAAIDLSFGVLFGLAFVVVRWVSLIDNMLSSGLLLLTCGAGLFLIARLWRHRQGALAPGGVR